MALGTSVCKMGVATVPTLQCYPGVCVVKVLCLITMIIFIIIAERQSALCSLGKRLERGKGPGRSSLLLS